MFSFFLLKKTLTELRGQNNPALDFSGSKNLYNKGENEMFVAFHIFSLSFPSIGKLGNF